jgi:nucleotide-binding universal stress UspA family protein
MTLQCPISKILLPVDGSEHSKRAIRFAGCIGSLLGKTISGVTLLHVIAGSYLSRHINYVDFRAEILKQSDEFKRIKNEHIERNIMPFINDGEKTLKELGLEANIEKIVIDGDPSDEIVSIADKGNFSTIIIARRGLSKIKGIFLGSVTNSVLHLTSKQTIYVVGYKEVEDRICPIPKILVPIDGSPYSLKGVEHAASLGGILKNSLIGITLLMVINIAFYEEWVLKGQDPEKEAQQLFDNAKDIFLRAGIPEELITTKIQIGRPADEILKEAEEGEYTLVVIGRKGRSAKTRISKIESALTSISFAEEAEFETAINLLGGVSSTVLNRCQQPTIAVVT